ncbi:MAG: tRNA 4-thiouridine(8) synthase ThiI [Deltaproteobacteria bacterium RIFOXYA12_FULL_58_15]|nr:MAG: tRNA 4-thiouridine(8) synthase ThiI [Deltaproteobacteria bacterium RIFOXYA12_FULL_58_15]OGR10842.1 MAG: tRNA 4-thiouridine(8) synthase ThiI [Deltaproteobacteria bacterium RIFOXYB12_FULL_58_9]
MKPAGIIVHYAEVATKGKNRPTFIKHLARNIGRTLAGLPFGGVQVVSGRLWIPSYSDDPPLEEAYARIRSVYGVASFSPVICAPLELNALKEAALSLVEGRTYETFRVTSRRVFKNQPLASLDVNRQVGEYLWEHHPAKVKLKDPEMEVFIEMLPEGAYLYTDKIPGPRGLPVGVTGKVATLLSGGIDSPVAAARMQRRGCNTILIHFHSHPFLSRASQEKARDLAVHLARSQQVATLYLVPFGELQREIVTVVPPPLRVVLYRRFMLRIAGEIALREHCRALVTGESLGQVASQTLSNMVAIESASPLPVLRPLIGFDKQEIIEEAQRLGTFETSILPDQDCCTLFIPRDPETHAKHDAVAAAEAKLDIDRMCNDALQRMESFDALAPWITRRPRPVPENTEDTEVTEKDRVKNQEPPEPESHAHGED